MSNRAFLAILIFMLLAWPVLATQNTLKDPEQVVNGPGNFLLAHFLCNQKEYNFLVLTTYPKINCFSPSALYFARKTQDFKGAKYVLTGRVTKDVQSCSGLVIATMQVLAKEGIVASGLKRMETLASQDVKILKKQAAKRIVEQKIGKVKTKLTGLTVSHKVNGKVVYETHPCVDSWKSVAVSIFPGQKVMNWADTMYGCFWLEKIGKRITKLDDLRTGDLVFFDSTYKPPQCPRNDAPKGYYYSEKKGGGCFRGVRGKPITHVGIVQAFDSIKGILYTFEQTSAQRKTLLCESVGSGAKPRMWCLKDAKHKSKRLKEEERLCENNLYVDVNQQETLTRAQREDIKYAGAGRLELFAGGIRLTWERNRGMYDVWSTSDYKPKKSVAVPVDRCAAVTKKACPSTGMAKYSYNGKDPKETQYFGGKSWPNANPECIFKKTSEISKVPFSLLKEVMFQESAGSQFATSDIPYKEKDKKTSKMILKYDHARGYVQLMEGTAAGMGIDKDHLFDPYENICGGVHYLTIQLKRFGYVECALAAYNAGPGIIKKGWTAKDCREKPPTQQTRDYVKKITANWKKNI